MAEYLETITTNKIEYLTDLTKLSAASIKGWLFTYYTILNDIERCDAINYQSFKYRNKIVRDSSADDITLRNTLQENNRNQRIWLINSNDTLRKNLLKCAGIFEDTI